MCTPYLFFNVRTEVAFVVRQEVQNVQGHIQKTLRPYLICFKFHHHQKYPLQLLVCGARSPFFQASCPPPLIIVTYHFRGYSDSEGKIGALSYFREERKQSQIFQ